MLSLLLALAAAAPATDLVQLEGARAVSDGALVRLSLNSGDYRPGDRVRVEVDVAEDGYLVVFRVDGDGLIRVLFPLDPDLDPFVRGGRSYELRGRGARETFLADDRGGTGMVYAALSREPLDLSRYANGQHWDYSRLRLEGDDAEAELTWFLRQMSPTARFEYDVLGYRVYGPGFEESPPVIVTGGGSPYYDPYLDCLACGWGTGGGTNVHVTIGNRWGWYDPWFDPWYGRGYRYGGGWGGYWGWDPYWGTPWRPITVINPYPRPTVPNTVYGVRSRPARPPIGAGGFQPSPTRIDRPAPGNTTPRPGAGGSTPTRPRAPQQEPTRARPTVERPAPTVDRTPDRSAPPANRPAPTTEREGRSRRPANEVSAPVFPIERAAAPVPVPTFERREEPRPVVDRRETSRPRVSDPSAERRTDDRPVYRPPTPAVERRAEPQRVERPVERRAERPVSSPPRESSRPSAPPPRVERPASAPAARSAPPPSRPSSPPPSAPRSRRPNN